MMMRTHVLSGLSVLLLVACGGGAPAESPADVSPADETPSAEGAASSDSAASEAEKSDGEFQLRDSDTAGAAHGANASKIQATATEAAMKFVIVDKAKEEPISGIVVVLEAPDGKKFYTGESDGTGYGEVLVPVGQDYKITFLSLGRRKITAKVAVTDEPRQNIKLTLRYKRIDPPARKVPAAQGEPEAAPGFVLKGIEFDTAKDTIRPDSLPRLASVTEFMLHKPSARLEISGHTDNVGQPAKNRDLSKRRAEAVKTYLGEQGIEGERIETVGYGDSQPVASNETPEGRQANRRIEAREL